MSDEMIEYFRKWNSKTEGLTLKETHIFCKLLIEKTDTLETRYQSLLDASKKLAEALTENMLYLVINNPENKKCDGCEPGNAYEPEFICGVHKLMNKTQATLASYSSFLKEQGVE